MTLQETVNEIELTTDQFDRRGFILSAHDRETYEQAKRTNTNLRLAIANTPFGNYLLKMTLVTGRSS